MKITLTTWERVQLALIVGSGLAPTIAAVGLGLKALKVLNLSDEDKAKVGFRAVSPNQFGWDLEQEYDLEFKDDVWQFVQVLTQAFQAWPIDERSKALDNKVREG